MKPSGSRLALYLTAARTEAYALLDVGAPYGRIIGRCDVAPSEILAVCRHQVETAGKVASLRYHDDGYLPATVARWVERACKDAAVVIGEGWPSHTVTESLEIQLAVVSDDRERDVYRAWFVATVRYLDEESDTLAAIASLRLTKSAAVSTLYRYGSVAIARAAADYAMVNHGEWPPTPAEVTKAAVGNMRALARDYPSAYGTWSAGKEVLA